MVILLNFFFKLLNYKLYNRNQGQNKNGGKPDGNNQKPQPENGKQDKPNESKDKGNDGKAGETNPGQGTGS